MFNYLESTTMDNLLRIVNETKEIQPSLRLIQVLKDGDDYMAIFETKE